MIVAVASIGREISSHFGHSDGCDIYYIENQQITEEKFIENPLMKLKGGLFCQHGETHKNSSCSCRFFAAFLLHEIKIDVMVTGHIGGMASQLLSQRGIKVIDGVKGKIDDYLQEYFRKSRMTYIPVKPDDKNIFEDVEVQEVVWSTRVN